MRVVTKTRGKALYLCNANKEIKKHLYSANQEVMINMINYEKFKKAVSESLLFYLAEDFDEYTVETCTDIIENTRQDILNIYSAKNINSADELFVSISIRLGNIYKAYLRTKDFNVFINALAMTVENRLVELKEVEKKMCSETIKTNIVYQLINTENNKGWLKDVPHREFLDMSIIYRVVFFEDNPAKASKIISNTQAEKLGVNEEDLFKLARVNTVKLLQPVIKTREEALRDNMTTCGYTDEAIDEYIEDFPIMGGTFILSSKCGFTGATSILYEDILEDVYMKTGKSFYLVPLSIHEMIVETSMPLENLKEVLRETNRSVGYKEDYLSDNVYFYDKDTKTISIA